MAQETGGCSNDLAPAKSYSTCPCHRGKADTEDGAKKRRHTLVFRFTLAVFMLLVTVGVVVLVVWRKDHSAGFNWHFNRLNFHMLFSYIAFIVLLPLAMLTYRLVLCLERRCTRLVHMFMHVLVFIFTLVGLYSAWCSSHNLKSVHSLLGLATVILFIGQYVAAFIVFLVPELSSHIQNCFKSYHAFLGVSIFACSVVCVMTGIMAAGREENTDGRDGVLMGVLAMTVLIASIIAAFLIVKPEFARQDKDEEELLPLK